MKPSLTLAFDRTLTVAAELMIASVRIRTPEEAIAFASAFNAMIAALWPEAFADDAPDDDAEEQEEEHDLPAESPAEAATAEDTAAPPPPQHAPRPSNKGAKLRPLIVKPGSPADAVLACLNRGVVDAVAIADELDMLTSTAAMLKGRLINAGHWSPA